MKKKSTLQNIFYNSFGALFYYGCQWVLTVIIVKLAGYGTGGQGDFSLAQTFTGWLAIVALFNVRQFQVSDVKNEYSDKVYINTRFVSCILAVAACAIALLFNDYTFYQCQVILLYMLFKAAESFIDVLHGIDQKAGRMDIICYSFLIRGVGMIAGFCIGLAVFKEMLVSILVMTVITILCALFYDYPMAKKFIIRQTIVDKTADFKKIRGLLILLTPLVIVAVTNNLSITLPRYYLERYWGTEVLGYYTSVATPAMVVQLAASTIFTPLITPLASKLAENDKKGFIKILKNVSIAFVVLSIIALIGSELLGDWFLNLIFDNIEDYTYLFVPVIVSTLFIAMNASLFPVCTVLRQLKGQLVVGIAGIAVTIVSSMYFVQKYSMNGLVISLCISLMVQILLEILCIYRKMRSWKG